MRLFTKTLFLLAFLMIGTSCTMLETGGERMASLREDASYYTERYRPQYHFSTPVGNLADPNGLVFYKGEYHLFHQKNGTWAHAVSKDLLHWEHLPIALERDHLGQALSGSVVVDEKDTSGLFGGKPGLVAIYTNTEGGEAQSIAYSKDDGRTWERYVGNPVIPNTGMKDFRDPKVFWHEETAKWVMVVSTNQTVSFYHSDNLIDWAFASQFGAEEGLHAAVWECPDLFRLPVDGDEDNQKWVLHVSVGDNDETNGSTAQYFVGEFDGTAFTNDNDAAEVLITDIGQDFYAAQTFANLDGRTVWLGWMANWRYPYQSPTDPWMGAMSIPRELGLYTNSNGQVRLRQKPISELDTIYAKQQDFAPFDVANEATPLDFKGTTYRFTAEVSWEDLREFGLRLRHGNGVESLLGFDGEYQKVFLDRTNAGLETIIDRNGQPFPFGQRYEADYDAKRGFMKLDVLVDESSIEWFINDGELTFTSLIYTDPTNAGIEWYADGGSIHVQHAQAIHLHNVWRARVTEGQLERIVTNEETVWLEIGETRELIADLKPDYNVGEEMIEWGSSDEDIVTIIDETERGVMIAAVGQGSAEVVAREQKNRLEKRIRVYSTGEGEQ